MAFQKIGYIRVSTDHQDPNLQLKGISLDKCFVEIASGKDAKRPQLEILLQYAREGDTIYVSSIDRIARNLVDLRKIISLLTGKGVKIEFIRERMAFQGDDSPMSMLVLNVMGSLAEFERNLMLERQRDGIERAKAAGLFKGRKKSLTPDAVNEIKEAIKLGVTKSHLARKYKVSRETIYQYLRSNQD